MSGDDDYSVRKIQLGFLSGAIPDDDVELQGVSGQEELSKLFAYELLLVRASGAFTDSQLDGLLHDRCAIGMGTRPGDIVHGMLDQIELIESSRTGVARYRARLVPNVTLLDLGQNCGVYQNTTVPDLIRTVLTGYGLSEGSDFEVRVSRDAKSPLREYIAQYRESDWAFLSRWMEHEGFFYWFKHEKSGEKLVIADDNGDATAIDDPGTINHRDRNNLPTGNLPTVWDWRLVQRRVPKRVAVLDYNYRTPDKLLVGLADVAEQGFGTSLTYGDHFKDKNLGDETARIRAERHMTERRTFIGHTDCARFRVGHTFELENHFMAEQDGKYLITSIRHGSGYATSGDGQEPRPYQAEFTATPIDVPFRPARVTPWPHIHGVMHGHIDADGSGAYAQIDKHGRYKVKLPFDHAEAAGLSASRWVRFSQPYSGSGYGMHHPLHKGTEVLLSYVDGDPDRPIIVGSVPNPHTSSPSIDANATQSVVQTASGIRIEMEDLQR